MTKMTKTASNFEAAFADLAYTYIKEASPKLMQFVVGFQVVDKNDDETRSVAVFGFDVNGSMFYAPVFFLKGELKGYDLLFAQAQDMFVPLEEKWVDYLINRGLPALGESMPDVKPEEWVADADISEYITSPMGKQSAAPLCGYWVRGRKFDLRPFCTAVQRGAADERFTKAAARLDIREFVKEGGVPAAAALVASLAKHSALSEKFFRFYDLDDITSLQLDKTAGKIEKGDEPLKDVKVTYTPTNYDKVDGEKLKDLVRDGYVVRDKDGKTTVVKAEVCEDLALSAPLFEGHGGMFNALTDSGPDEVFISNKVIDIEDGRQVKDYDDNKLYLVAGAKKHPFQMLPAHKVTVVADVPSEDVATAFTMPVSDITASKENQYTVLTEHNACLSPFTVLQTEEDKGLKILYITAVGYYGGCAPCGGPGKSLRRYPVKGPDGYEVQAVRVVILPASQGVPSVRIDDSGVYIADSCRALSRPRMGPSFALVTQRQLISAAVKTAGFKPFRLWRSGDTYFVKGLDGRDDILWMTKRALYENFAGNLDCPTAVVHDMCAAVEKGPADFMIKHANPMAAMYGGPQQFDPQSGAMLSPQQDVTGAVPGMEGIPPEHMSHGDEAAMLNPYDAQMAEGAPEDKEVFDTAVIAGLVKSMRVPELIESYIGDLVVGMDRLGRMLFLFYWHNDEVADTYGDTELTELEDNLRNTFSGLGDLVLFLKQKTIEPTIALVGDKGLSSI